MKTPKKNRETIKTNRLAIAISDSEKRKLEEIADEKGVTMSSLARMVLRDFFKKEEL